MFLPLLNRSFFAFVDNPMIVASVIVLLFGGCPADVPWTIAGIIILSINGIFSPWFWSNFPEHVFKEILEDQPAVTDCYPSPSIARIFCILGIQHTGFHATPPSIFCGMAIPVQEHSLTGSISSQTSTALRVAISQAFVEDGADYSAIALAYRLGSTVEVLFCWPQNNKASKALSDFKWWVYSMASHLESSFSAVVRAAPDTDNIGAARSSYSNKLYPSSKLAYSEVSYG